EAFDGEAEVPPLAAVDSVERPSCANRRLRRRHRIAEALGEVDPARDKLRFDRPAISHAHHADRTGVYTRDGVRTGVELFDIDARIGFVDHGNSSMAGRRAIAACVIPMQAYDLGHAPVDPKPADSQPNAQSVARRLYAPPAARREVFCARRGG